MNINIHRKHTCDFIISLLSFIIPYSCSLSILVFLLSLLHHYNISYDSVPLDRYFYWVSIIISLNLTFTYFLTMLAISSRLASVVEYLDSKSAEEVRNHLNLLAKVYMKFSDVVSLSNEIFTFNSMILFLEFTTFSVSMTFLCFTTFQNYMITKEISFKEIIFILTCIAFLLNLVINACFTFHHSHLFVENSTKILTKLHKISTSSSKDESKTNRYTQIFSLYAAEEPLLQTCGLFLFDWKQLFLMFSSIYSYLLILIQFDMSL